jgi:hypothetical protein
VIDSDEDHPLLTSRHVDNLDESIRALTRIIALGAQHHREMMDAVRAQTEILRDIRRTADAMLDTFMKMHTNGTGS